MEGRQEGQWYQKGGGREGAGHTHGEGTAGGMSRGCKLTTEGRLEGQGQQDRAWRTRERGHWQAHRERRTGGRGSGQRMDYVGQEKVGRGNNTQNRGQGK